MRKVGLLGFVLIALLSPLTSWGGTDQDIAELKRVQEVNSKTLAEAVQNITALRQELQELKGSIEEAQHFIQEGTSKNDKILREFDYRLTGVEERMTLQASELAELSSKMIPKKKGVVTEAESTLYRRALTEINLQNFKSSLQLFTQFLEKYPRSVLADNAQYWKGEALYASKDYPNAVLEFQKVIKKYPKSEKVPGAILKQGYSLYEAKEYLDSKAFLQKVITNYPKSDEAAEAKERIQKIDLLLAKKTSSPTTQPAPALPTTPPTTTPAGEIKK